VAKFVLTDARLFTGGADLATSTNKIEVSADFDDLDVTNFASQGWKEVIAGLASTSVNADGFWEAGDPTKVDDAAWLSLGGIGPWTVCPSGGGAAGSLAYFTNAMNGSYNLGGDVGKVAPWSAKVKGTWPLVRGQIAHPAGTARTATGTGTGVNLGAIPAGKQLYTALHVLSVAGTATPTITVAVESDTTSGFALPTTRTTFAAATAVGGQILRTAGPITDTWFRPKWTISGTAPSFLFVVAFGVA
jgi:hypothetical protein